MIIKQSNYKIQIKHRRKKEIKLLNLLKNKNRILSLRKLKLIIKKKILIKIKSSLLKIIYKSFLKFIKKLQVVILNSFQNFNKIKSKKKNCKQIKKLMKKFQLLNGCLKIQWFKNKIFCRQKTVTLKTNIILKRSWVKAASAQSLKHKIA